MTFLSFDLLTFDLPFIHLTFYSTIRINFWWANETVFQFAVHKAKGRISIWRFLQPSLPLLHSPFSTSKTSHLCHFLAFLYSQKSIIGGGREVWIFLSSKQIFFWKTAKMLGNQQTEIRPFALFAANCHTKRNRKWWLANYCTL